MLIADNILRWAADICLVGAILGCLYVVVAGLLVLRFRTGQTKPEPSPVPVTILVPLCGNEPGLDRRLRALCAQDYAAPFQIVCGVRDAADPAIEIARTVAAAHPQQDVDLHIDPAVHGRNLKISNLINMVPRARHDTFVLIDSDIEVGPDFLSRVMAELQAPGTAAVSCLYHGVAGGGIWSRLAAMRINAHFLPDVIVALTFGLARPCFGASIAISRETLRQIGGLPAFVDQLWEDYAIGAAVRALGRRVAIPSFALGHVYAEGSARALFADELRAARTIRNIAPAGHLGSIVTHPLPLALIALLVGGGRAALALAIIAWACRTGLCWCVERRFKVHSNSYLLVLLRDLLSFAVYLASFLAGTVTWRGRRYRVPPRTPLPDAG
jgi:ceramide glucosyltransferase